MVITGYTYNSGQTLKIKLKYLYCLEGSLLPQDTDGNAVLPDDINSIKDLFDYNTLELIVTANGENVYTTTLIKINSFPDYLIQTNPTGIYMNGNVGKLIAEFIDDYSYIDGISSKLYSNYITEEIIITDEEVLQKLIGNKFQINFGLNKMEYKSILLEEFEVTTNSYETTTDTDVYTTNIGFELDKKVDNKKSWAINNKVYYFDEITDILFENGNELTFTFTGDTSLKLYTPFTYKPSDVADYGITSTQFYVTTSGSTIGTTYYDLLDYFDDGNGKIERNYVLLGNTYSGSTINLRTTDYNADDSRLILNTKEVSLSTNVSQFLDDAIILSIWKDSLSNYSYSDLFDINDFETIEDFKFYLNNNFGNALTIKTSAFNEWLLKLLDIYNARIILNPLDIDNDNVPIYNSNYDIPYIINLINQIDDRWFNMLENVVPSTMIWEYIKIIKNGFIYQNKYQYKRSNIILENSSIVEICTNTLETVTGATAILDTVVVEDTTSDIIVLSNIYTGTTISITQLNYNQMFGGYYYYGDNISNLVYNDLISGTFTKNNCISGYTGTDVDVVISGGTYSACTLEAANQLALDAAQIYANEYGTCSGGAAPDYDTMVAPVGFDPDAEDLNIISLYNDYDNTDKTYIFAVSNAVTSTNVSPCGGDSYYYGELIDGDTEITTGFTSGTTISWTLNSTKRFVVVNSTTLTGCVLPYSSTWVYVSSSITNIKASSTYILKYIHCEDIGSITTINRSDFGNCFELIGLLNIPSSVTSIGDYSFSGCESLISVNIPSSVTSIGKYSFSGCGRLNSVIIPSSVTSIGDAAFQFCGSLTSITIPSSITSIGDSAFQFCGSLTSITIPSSITSIGDGAFAGCTGLTSINIGSSVTTIGYSAFANCRFLISVICENPTPPILGRDSFYDNPTTNILYVPTASVSAYSSSDWNSNFSQIIGI